MIDLRGYPAQLVTDRLAAVEHLVIPDVVHLGRPVAILLRLPQQTAALQRLESTRAGRRLFEDASGRVVWFCPRDQVPILMER
jgi:hypothetical protein